METLIVTIKNKKSANQIRKILKNIEEVEKVKTLTEEEKEDIGLSIAIEKGFTGDLVNVEILQNKLRLNGNSGR